MIVGVRRKDCSKLNKDYWSSWEDFKKYVCKDYLINNKKKVVDSEKARAYSENRVSMEDYSSISGLMDNSKFRHVVQNNLDKDHIITIVTSDLALMSDYDNTELQTISRMISFLKKVDQDWVDKNIPSTYDMDQFNNNCKQIIDKYPLLINISREVYAWRCMEQDNLGKNLMDYVLMCDLVGEGN